MIRKRVLNIAFVILRLALATCLIMNKVKINQQRQYNTHLLYNQLMNNVEDAYPPSSYFPGYQRAAIDIAYAADDLESLSTQAFENEESYKTARLIQEDASFVSYLALALIGQSETFMMSDGKTVITITPTQGKTIVAKMNRLIFKNAVNSVNGFGIPDSKIVAVYSGIYSLIPSKFYKLPGGGATLFNSLYR